MSEATISLSPNRIEFRDKTYTLYEREWKLAVQVVDKGGFRTNAFAGFDRQSAKQFAAVLAGELEQEKMPGGDREVLFSLVLFLRTSGAGGCALERGWRRINRT